MFNPHISGQNFLNVLMKRFKNIFFIISLWFMFSGIAFGKTAPVSEHFKTIALTAKFSVKHFNTVLHSKQICKKHYKKVRLKAIKKSVKGKAAHSYSNLLPKIYVNDIFWINGYVSKLIYGITVIYCIPRHTYLHLYQLF